MPTSRFARLLCAVTLSSGCVTAGVVDDFSTTRVVWGSVPSGETPRALVSAVEHDDGAITLRTRYSDRSSRFHRWVPPRDGSIEALVPLTTVAPETVGRELAVVGDEAELRLVGARLERRRSDCAYLAIATFPVDQARRSRTERLGDDAIRAHVGRLVVLLPVALVIDAATLPLQVLLYPLLAGFRDGPT